MRLDSVLGYINPEMQMPNTVLFWAVQEGDGTHSGSLAGQSSQGRAGVSVEASMEDCDGDSGCK